MKKIAHRGNYKTKCENKINCLLEVLNKDIDGIEIDVRMTKDKKMVLSHNSFILKNNQIYCIEKTKYELIKLDLLDTFLSKMNNKIVLIDMKCLYDEKKYANTIIKIIKKYPKLNIELSSFNYSLISYIKKRYPNYLCGLIIGYQINIKKDYNNFDFISIHENLVSKYLYPHYIWGKNFKKIDSQCIGIIVDKKN